MRVAVSALAALILLGAAVGWIDRSRLDSAVTAVGALDSEARSSAGDDPLPGETVLYIGADLGTGPDGSPRPDTVALIHLPADGARVVAVPFPSSLEITRPPCDRWDPSSGNYLDETVRAETGTTLDTAYANGGPRCTVRVVQQLTGLTVTRVAAVDLQQLAAATGAAGGVEVCATRPVIDRTLGPVLPTAGPSELDPDRALNLARAADVGGEPPGELGRLRRQAQWMQAVLERAHAPSTLLLPWRTGALAETLRTAMITDGLDARGLLALATTLTAVDDEPVAFAPLPTSRELNVRGHLSVRERDAAALFDALRTGQPLPAPEIDPAAAVPAPAPEDVLVDVLNASDRDGLANRISGSLAEYGFTVGEVGNAPEPATDTVVRHSPDRVDAAELLAGTVPQARQEAAPGTSGVLQLVLGGSFDGDLQAPQDLRAPDASPVADRDVAVDPPLPCR